MFSLGKVSIWFEWNLLILWFYLTLFPYIPKLQLKTLHPLLSQIVQNSSTYSPNSLMTMSDVIDKPKNHSVLGIYPWLRYKIHSTVVSISVQRNWWRLIEFVRLKLDASQAQQVHRVSCRESVSSPLESPSKRVSPLQCIGKAGLIGVEKEERRNLLKLIADATSLLSTGMSDDDDYALQWLATDSHSLSFIVVMTSSDRERGGERYLVERHLGKPN